MLSSMAGISSDKSLRWKGGRVMRCFEMLHNTALQEHIKSVNAALILKFYATIHIK